jgi:putative YphP/YqiW family bacilliredoxin
MYDSQLVQPMRDEVTRLGVEELRTTKAVATFLGHHEGTALLFVNSVCGCAAGNARPALELALRSDVIPERLATVFAGQDAEATAAARAHFPSIPASSPSIYLVKDGKLVHHIPRETIESRDAVAVARELVESFQAHC